jgi:hypothetical protein
MESTQIEFQIHSGGTSINIEGSATSPSELIVIVARIMTLSAAQAIEVPLRKMLIGMGASALSVLEDEGN